MMINGFDSQPGIDDDLACWDCSSDFELGNDLHSSDMVFSRRDERPSTVCALRCVRLLDRLPVSFGHVHLRWFGNFIDISDPASFEDLDRCDAVETE